MDITKPRGVDPVTSDIKYDEDDLEFMNAVDEYKREKGRRFPTIKEHLMILKSLGYSKKQNDPDSITVFRHTIR